MVNTKRIHGDPETLKQDLKFAEKLLSVVIV